MAEKECQIIPFTSKVTRAEFTKLKSNFVWGAATSAFQIEGATSEGGRGPSIWDTFCLKNPSIFKDDNKSIGVDAYYKMKEDVQMIKKMGLNAYRFSISWSRILPGGTPKKGVNREGVDYYNNLINELKANQIEPYVTLWHWDTPDCLEDEYGGFINKRIIHDFMAYAEFCFWEFGDRVVNWITFNEPANYAEQGYDIGGTYAPGRKRNPTTEPYIVAHNILLCHTTVVDLYRQRFKETQEARIGITLDSLYLEPLHHGNEEDKVASLRAIKFHFGWFMKPLVAGKYPKCMEKSVGDRLPKFTKEQAKLVKGSYDFLGLNYYCTYYATTGIANEGGSCAKDSNVIKTPIGVDGKEIGDKGGVEWFYSYPVGLRKLLLYIKKTYDDPVIIITENGWPDQSDNSLKFEEACHDEKRIKYHDEHLQSIHLAMMANVKVEGYFAWSLLDNFEWSYGYSVRFGLIYIDYKDGKYSRYPKDSAMWFRSFLKKPKDTKKRGFEPDGNASEQIAKK